MTAQSVGSPSPSSPYPTSLFGEKGNYSPDASAAPPKRVLFPKCPQYPELPCQVCGDPCVVRTSHTEKNPNRDFYTCARGMSCNMFQWCDEVGKIRPRGMNNPVKHTSPLKPGLQRDGASSQNPTCICGAGPCRVETKQNGEFKGRKYFACHLKKGQGACTHFKWCDDHGETKVKDAITPDETIVLPDSPEGGSPSKPERDRGWLNEFIASPAPMDCETSPRISPVKESPSPRHVEPQLGCSPMKRLSLNDGGGLRNPETCVVCGAVGHGVIECAALAML